MRCGQIKHIWSLGVDGVSNGATIGEKDEFQEELNQVITSVRSIREITILSHLNATIRKTKNSKITGRQRRKT